MNEGEQTAGALGFIVDRLLSWLTEDPILMVMMFGTAFVLFIMKLKEQKSEDVKFWQWARRILEAVGTALLFLVLLWVFRGVLGGNYQQFTSSHGRVSEVNYESVQNIWGGPHVQRELTVTHRREVTKLEEIPREDPALPPLYRKKTVNEAVPQNSILSATGKARLVQNRRQKGSAFYSGFETSFSIEYGIINDSSETTQASFYFPLSSNQAMYDKLSILEDGRDLSEGIQVDEDGIYWVRDMKPQERITVSVSYETRGLEYFYYQIPAPREINNFSFQLELPDLPVAMINYPGGCVPPTSEIKPIADGKGCLLEWKFSSHAITTAGMGIALPQPEQPGYYESLVLRNSPSALMFLVITVCISFLLLGRKLRFFTVTLMASLYCLLFYVISSLSGFSLGFWGTFAIGAPLTLALTFLLFLREKSLFLKLLVMGLTGFFTVVYPLLNLITEYETSINGIVVILVILYVFGVAYLTQVRKKEQPANDKADGTS